MEPRFRPARPPAAPVGVRTTTNPRDSCHNPLSKEMQREGRRGRWFVIAACSLAAVLCLAHDQQRSGQSASSSASRSELDELSDFITSDGTASIAAGEHRICVFLIAL